MPAPGVSGAAAARGLLLRLVENVIMSITRILVPTDFSEAAGRALEYGGRLAMALGAELTVLHVVAPPTTHSWMEPADRDGATTEEWLAEAHATLNEAIDTIRGHAANVRGIVGIGLEAEEILDFTSRHGIDLVVMGMHGHGRTARWLRGSVTDQVLRRASCPVLAIPACVSEGHAPGTDDPIAFLRTLTAANGEHLVS
jgi:nucleotide-binding universal stress UspA family protein